MSKEKSGIVGVYAGREVTAQDIADAFSELEAVQQKNKELKEHRKTVFLTCEEAEHLRSENNG